MKVRLKQSHAHFDLLAQRCFNSMKVRLKQQQRPASSFAAVFQFHEGPIKTGNGSFDFEAREQFQFHEGPIKTVSTRIKKSNKILFQFHEGPIKTSYH